MKGIDLQGHRFPLEEDALPEAPHIAPQTVYRNHGRQIARNRDGIWFCALQFDRHFRDRNWLGLSISADAAGEGCEFHPPILLVGRDDAWFHPIFAYQGALLATVCLVMDRQDRLHVIYEQESGVYVTSADASGGAPHARLSQAGAWAAPRRVAEAGVELGDAGLTPDGHLLLYVTRQGALYEQPLDAAAERIAEQGERPSVFVDAAGTCHVAFEHLRRVLYTRNSGAGWTDSSGRPGAELVAHFCSSWPSIAATPQGRVVIAYQGEGKVDLKAVPQLYVRNRPAGGSTVSYAVLADGAWTIRNLARSREVVLFRRASSSMPSREGRITSAMEEFWRPSLAVDRMGGVWLFYANTTRRHLFFARFHGEAFGDTFEARGPYDVMSRCFWVQKESFGHAAIGAVVLACQRFHFTALTVPEYASAQPRRVVFLDNLEADEMFGLEHQIGVWRKHHEPLFGAFISGDSLDDHIQWCQAVKAEGGFELRYMGAGKLRNTTMPGRAFSADGLRWTKRPPADISHWTLDGAPFLSSFWRPIFLKDPDEKDPGRRYKGLLAKYRFVDGIELRAWEVVTSPDGCAWHSAPDLPPIVQGDISVGFHLFRDDEDAPARRYKAVMLMGALAGRCPVVFTSPDLLHWSDVYHVREDADNPSSAVSPYSTGPIAIDPDAAENPWEEEVHDAIVWRENGLLMFHYDAFYFAANQHTQKALAISRDGRHYYRVKRGAVNMPIGACGEWDSGRDRTGPPIRVGDELWLYFCGMPAGCFSDADRDDPLRVNPRPPSPAENEAHQLQRPWRVGMARLRADGWGYLQVRRDERRGVMTTIPFEYDGGDLVVNGCGLGEGLRVEVRDAQNRGPTPGFEAAHCRFSSPDAVSSRVSWKSGKALPPGRYRLRFSFEDLRARLYAFGFERPR